MAQGQDRTYESFHTPSHWASRLGVSYLLEEAEGLLGGRGGHNGVAASGAGSKGEGQTGHHLGLQLRDTDLLLCHSQQCLPEHRLCQWGHHLRESRGVREQEGSTVGLPPGREKGGMDE